MLDYVLRNWPLKLLALALAFAIWVAVTGENRIVQDFRVPVDIALPRGLIPGESSPTTVNVRLRGPETLFRRLDPLPLELNVDLRDASPGPRNVQLSAANLAGVPRDVEVAAIEPDRFRVLLERRTRRVVPVAPFFVGQPPPGYAFYDARIIPDSLEVEGPDSRVSVLTGLRTDPIHLEGRTSSFSTRVNAVPTSAEVRVLDPRPLEAQVEIDEAPVIVTFHGVPIVLAGQAYEAMVVPTNLSATLSGPPALLRRLRREKFRAIVDLTGLAPAAESYHLPVRVDFLDMPTRDLTRITVRSVSRPRVSVKVSNRRISG